MSSAPLPKAAKPVWAKQLARLHCLVVNVNLHILFDKLDGHLFAKPYLEPGKQYVVDDEHGERGSHGDAFCDCLLLLDLVGQPGDVDVGLAGYRLDTGPQEVREGLEGGSVDTRVALPAGGHDTLEGEEPEVEHPRRLVDVVEIAEGPEVGLNLKQGNSAVIEDVKQTLMHSLNGHRLREDLKVAYNISAPVPSLLHQCSQA